MTELHLQYRYRGFRWSRPFVIKLPTSFVDRLYARGEHIQPWLERIIQNDVLSTENGQQVQTPVNDSSTKG